MSSNLINPFSNEIIRMIHYAKENSTKACFDTDYHDETYYVEYDKSNHCGEMLSEYDSENVWALRNKIEMCLKEDVKVVDIIMSAMEKRRGILKDSGSEIDLYNYMM